MSPHRVASALPPRAGVGFKPEHFDDVMALRPAVGFFEIHAENYMGEGGPPYRRLEALRTLYPLSLHGVGLSIGGPRALDREHLKRLAALRRRYEPGLFSEHLAWSSHDEGFLNDLLPLPYTHETLQVVCDHIDETQAAVGRMLLENPSTYVRFAESDIPREYEVMGELIAETDDMVFTNGEKMQNKLIEEAKKKGADGIVLSGLARRVTGESGSSTSETKVSNDKVRTTEHSDSSVKEKKELRARLIKFKR